MRGGGLPRLHHPYGANRLVQRLRLALRVGTHGRIVVVIIHVDIGHGQPERIFHFGVQGDAVGGARHVLTVDEDARQVAIVFHHEGEIAAPHGAGQTGQRQARQIQGRHFQMVSAGETTLGIVLGLIFNNAGQGRAPPEVDWLIENPPDKAARVTGVIAPDLIA